MAKKVLILDYGHGNANSIKNALSKMDVEGIYSNKKNDIELADAIILPGVGHFGPAADTLINLELEEIINFKAFKEKVPILGICLGFQLMCKYSQEANQIGLGWINGIVKKIQPDNTKVFKVPHIGWRTLDYPFPENFELFRNINDDAPFYFCHKFSLEKCDDGATVSFSFDKKYIAAYKKENIFGVQFHPEKSQNFGLRMLQNFLEVN